MWIFLQYNSQRRKEVLFKKIKEHSTYSELSCRLLKHAKEIGGTTSIAHNGSSPAFIRAALPYINFASIDIKASTPSEFALYSGHCEDTVRCPILIDRVPKKVK